MIEEPSLLAFVERAGCKNDGELRLDLGNMPHLAGF